MDPCFLEYGSSKDADIMMDPLTRTGGGSGHVIFLAASEVLSVSFCGSF